MLVLHYDFYIFAKLKKIKTMKKFLFLPFVIFLLSMGVQAQKGKEVLMTIDNTPIYAKEFKRVYKKNLELVQEESQKSVDGYLDLFIDYKLKVAEAYAQKLNKKQNYIKDFKKYQEQLSKNYITDQKITDEVLREAYNRTLEEIEASHILVRCEWDAFPKDTLKAYNKIKEIRNRVLEGEDFSKLAAETSEDNSAKGNKGYLGYFSCFGMVYPFETEAYKTTVGEISNIVRTNFGYHIIKVTDRRKKSPPVTVSHIMISTIKDTSETNTKQRINEIYGLLQKGEAFEDLAKQYSDDKATGLKGGRMRPFSRGDLKAPPFEEASYKIKNIGDISNPIQTRFGWHIIRLEDKGVIPTYQEKKAELEKRITGTERLNVIYSAVNNKIKERYGFESYNYLPFFQNFVTDSIFKKKWKYTTLSKKENKPLFRIGDSTYTYNDFSLHLAKRQHKLKSYKQKKTLLTDLFDELVTEKLKNYFKIKLEEENDEYAGIIQEYRDGLLIFDVMAENVWNKAKSDTIGQMKYYNTNAENYRTKQQVNAQIFTSSNKKVITDVLNKLNKGVAAKEIKKAINTNGDVNILLTEGEFEIDRTELPQNFEIKKGVSKIYEGDSTFTIVKVDEIIPPYVKEFDAVKGKVISDFQNEIEKEWMKKLKEKYSIEINKKTLNKLKKELDS